ncbi:hypothetical protein [Enterobacter sp. CGMCC 5087]|uniref:beta-sandwich lipoprotein n=1 Tax=Enterobacter sp. CGMCC 5087 TaxID=2183878 RepID=UPI001C62CA4A|nr:hypothetical protein [Enterobacter sp. CGMCC 5087]
MLLLAVMLLAACDVNDADVVSQNLSKDSDNFQVNRRFVFYNGITGDYVLTIEGLCTKDNTSTATTLGVICQVGPNQYKKHMLGLSDNVTMVHGANRACQGQQILLQSYIQAVGNRSRYRYSITP